MPLLEVVRAARRLGHETVVLVAPSLADDAAADEHAGPVQAGGQPPPDEVQRLWERVRRGPPEAVRGLIDRELFAGTALDAMLEPARRLVADERPDLVVREACEYATAIAAHEAGVPHAQVGVSPAAVEASVLRMVAGQLDRRAAGVAGAIAAAPYVTAFPAPLDPSPWADTRRHRPPADSRTRHAGRRTGASGRRPDAEPAGGPSTDARPLVYMTFGTVLGHLAEAGEVFASAVGAVAELPVRVLLTVGRAFDPATLGTLPANVDVRRWVRQADALAAADLVVCHGGSGTTFGALAAGLPLVVCPLFADQAANAETVRRAGAGTVVRSGTLAAGGLATLRAEDATALRAAIETTLREPSYGRAARALAAEIATAPATDELVEELLTGLSGTAPRGLRVRAERFHAPDS